MDSEELKAKMLAYINTQNYDYDEEWYASRWDFAAVILSDFAEYLGFPLEVPPYVRIKEKSEIDRAKMLEALLPEVTRLFEIEFKKYKESQ
jgi:hypothetical protein